MYRLIQPKYDDCCEFDEFENGINTIKGDNFRKLMDICYDITSYISFTKAPWWTCIDIDLEKAIEPYLIGKKRVQKWFCYDLTTSNHFLDVHIYKASPAIKNILIESFDDIFLRTQEHDTLADSTQTLEDLCMFTEKSLLLGTVTHESICHVYPPNNTIEQALLLTGRWKYSKDSSLEHITID